ncbi:hypothetical protein F4692_002608 [Nocardioides cavernae]|uniref:DUF4240 domain-containing protein n=1 Tax=Nocardioides cavernae TaxID=1921566 RepID=A0A7Y9H3X6_9ACTN|nr:DUF4240 domain-containing protein [Nocardioides cavernae]NYE37475.1 hypothetical protein [Nocardioides cavernae]
MRGDTRRRAYAWVGTALLAALAVGCSSDPVEPVTTEPWVEGGLPEYCGGRGGDLASFWELVHASCAVAQDGDVRQGEALEEVLSRLPEDRTAEFGRTFRRLNNDLVIITEVADDLCAPGLGLAEDLGTDYRSWVIAHGQDAYEAVLDDPARLRDFPDATAGCGLGEFFGAAATGNPVEGEREQSEAAGPALSHAAAAAGQ